MLIDLLIDVLTMIVVILVIIYLISVPVLFIAFIADGISAKTNGRKRKTAVTVWFILTSGTFWLLFIFLSVMLCLGMLGM